MRDRLSRADSEREGLSAEEAAQRSPRYRELLTAREREMETNAQEFKTVQGRELRYGMIVQLQHATSHLFLQVTRQDAHCNTDARRVELDKDGGEAAWVRIMPRLRVHSEGEKVHVGDPVALEHVQTSLKLHVEAPLADGRREVTATLAIAGFKVGLFRSFMADGLLGGQRLRYAPYMHHRTRFATASLKDRA